MMNIYYIGGSPCSGKSSMAEMIAKKYDFFYFKVDDYLEKYTALGASKGYEVCIKQSQMTAEQIWMRDVELQCREELQFYHEIFEFIQRDMSQQVAIKGIITEGAAFMPQLMNEINIDNSHYACVTPTKDFQIEHYRKREWVPYVLEGCSDKEQAFKNWMERDALFADEVRKQCDMYGYKSFVTDGQVNVQVMMQRLCEHFGLR